MTRNWIKLAFRSVSIFASWTNESRKV